MRFLKVDSSFLKWFYFGMRIKRWLLLLLIGVAIMGLGFGYYLREVYFSYTFPSWVYSGAQRLSRGFGGQHQPNPHPHPNSVAAAEKVAVLVSVAIAGC